MSSHIDTFLDGNIRKATNGGYTVIKDGSLSMIMDITGDFRHWVCIYKFLAFLEVRHIDRNFFGLHPSVVYNPIIIEHFDTPVIKNILYAAFDASIRYNGFDDFVHQERVHKLSYFITYMMTNHPDFLNEFVVRYKQEQDKVYDRDIIAINSYIEDI